MHLTAEQIDRQLEQLPAALQSAGVKATQQRIEVYREVLGSASHPDAETVFSGVRRRMPTVSLDTVYRTLWLLSDLGLIGTLGQPRERVRFDANTAPHHHFMCTECGATLDFTSAELDRLAVPSAAAALGQVRHSHVELHGVCNGCVAKAKTGAVPA